MKFKIISLAILGALSTNIYAGLNGYTSTSRANCINNESVAWDATQKWEMIVFSKHCYGDVCNTSSFATVCIDKELPGCHVVSTGNKPVITRRAAMVDWGEGLSGGWKVYGTFWRKIDDRWQLTSDETIGCSIYDGWIEWKNPDDEKNPKYDVKFDISKLPSSGQGIKIVSSNVMPMSNSNNNADIEYPKYLLSLEDKERHIVNYSSNEIDQRYTGIKKDINNLATTFDKKMINLSNEKIIGYSAEGTYKKNGWTGFNTYFKTEVATCRFTMDDVSSSNGTVILPKEKLRSDVNGKPTMTSIKGNKNSGYQYNVSWFDMSKKQISYDLVCASLDYSNDILNTVIAYAVSIDR